MAKLIQDPITFELRVRKLAHKFGFEANHGGTYDDPITDMCATSVTDCDLALAIRDSVPTVGCPAASRDFGGAD